jgi:hypothetical protein
MWVIVPKFGSYKCATVTHVAVIVETVFMQVNSTAQIGSFRTCIEVNTNLNDILLQGLTYLTSPRNLSAFQCIWSNGLQLS